MKEKAGTSSFDRFSKHDDIFAGSRYDFYTTTTILKWFLGETLSSHFRSPLK